MKRANNDFQPLLGLTPKRAIYIFFSYYEYSRNCTLALYEMIGALRRKKEAGEELFAENTLFNSRAVKVLSRLEDTREAFMDFHGFFSGHPMEKEVITPSSRLSEEERAAVDNLTAAMIAMARDVDDIGFFDFSHDVAYAIEDVETRAAYQDMVHALATVQTVYIAYVKSGPGNAA